MAQYILLTGRGGATYEAKEAALNEVFAGARHHSLNQPHLPLAKLAFQQSPWPYAALEEMDRNLLKLPEILAREAARAEDPDMRIAYRFLEDCFHLWFLYEASPDGKPGPEPLFIPWEWATNYDLAQDALRDLKKNLLNDAAKKELTERLENLGRNAREITPFDFTAGNPADWHDNAYQFRSVNHYPLKNVLKNPGYKGAWLPYSVPQYRALGDFTIRALPKGYVRPLKGGRHEICLNGVDLFVDDIFNFDGDAILGIWDFDNMRLVHGPSELSPERDDEYGRIILDNRNFRDFRERTGYGRDFRVLSPLHKLEDFKEECWRAPW